MNGSFDISTVVFAILAIFVVWKLRSVLGTRTGQERPPFDPFRRNPADPSARPSAEAGDRGKIIPLPGAAGRSNATSTSTTADADRWKGFAPEGSKAAAGLEQIARADRSFAAQPFMAGARAAYETILTAFAKGDQATLAPLLARDVLDGFNGAIAQREALGQSVETTFVGIDKAEIEDAQLRGTTAQIVVRFQSKLITVTRDKAGTVVDGSPDTVADIIDVWTFARDVTTTDPNWKLVATETAQ